MQSINNNQLIFIIICKPRFVELIRPVMISQPCQLMAAVPTPLAELLSLPSLLRRKTAPIGIAVMIYSKHKINQLHATRLTSPSKCSRCTNKKILFKTIRNCNDNRVCAQQISHSIQQQSYPINYISTGTSLALSLSKETSTTVC